jgi:hypothetical protein
MFSAIVRDFCFRRLSVPARRVTRSTVADGLSKEIRKSFFSISGKQNKLARFVNTKYPCCFAGHAIFEDLKAL